MYLNPQSPAVAKRQAVEVKIVKSLIDELLACTFLLSVDDGEDISIPSTDRKTIIDAIMNTDDDTLIVSNGKNQIGWVRLVYGNDGYDVISDYTVNLETFIPKTLALAERLGA